MVSQIKPKKRPVGRPPVPEKKSFDSMIAAAKHIGGDCSVEMLKAAKKAGCPAFRSGRIYVVELADWLKENKLDPGKPRGKEAYQVAKLKQEIRRLERQNELDEGALHHNSVCREINAKIDAEIVKALLESFGDPLNMKMDGANFAQRKILLQEAVDLVLAKIHSPEHARPGESAEE